MKSIYQPSILLITLIISALATLSDPEVLRITHSDTGEVFYAASEDLEMLTYTSGIEMSVMPYISNTDSGLQITDLIINYRGVEPCRGNDFLLLVFEDGETLNLFSWKDPSCDGQAFFRLDPSASPKLTDSPIQSITFRNGKTGEEYTETYGPEKGSYFIKIKELLSSKTFKNVITR